MFEFDNEQHPVVMAADATDMKAGTLDRITNAFTMGAPAAAASAALSVANTFLDITGQEQIDIGDSISKYDQQMGDYYADNKSAIDTVGFIGGAVVGGSLAIKGIQALRAGTATGSFGRSLNFATSRRDKYFQEAMKEVGREGGNVRSLLSSAARRKSLGWEVADQAALGLAAEIAIVGTMYKNPVFDGDSYGDFAQNMALGTVLSGGIGGLVSGFAAKGLLEAAGTEVQTALRNADTVFVPEKMKLGTGTATLLTAESILKLSDDIKSVSSKDLNGNIINIDIAEAATRAKTAAERGGYQRMQMQFNELAGGDAVTGQAYFNTIRTGIDAAKAAGKDANETLQLVNGYLANLAKVESINLDTVAEDARRFYVTREPAGATPKERFENIFSTRRSKETGRTAYKVGDDVKAEDMKSASLDSLGEPTLKAAFRNNPELDMIIMPNGSVRVNPKSNKIRRIPDEPYQVRQYIHLSTGTVTPETVPVFGDILGNKGFTATKTAITGGGRTYNQLPNVKFSASLPTVEASARFAWAGQLTIKDIFKLTEGVIETSDVAVMRRLVELAPRADTIEKAMLEKLSYKMGDDLLEAGDVQLTEAFTSDLVRAEVFKVLQAGGPVPSSHVLSVQLNTNLEWMEEVLSHSALKGTKLSDKAKLLSTDSALAPQNVLATWDFRGKNGKLTPEAAYELNMGPGHLASKELTKEYQYAVADFINKSAMNNALGADAALFEQFADDLARDTNIRGAGASAFGASNASYGERAKLAVQNMGKQVELVTQQKRDAVVSTLTPQLNAVRDNVAASAEWGVLTNALRLNPNAMLFDDALENTLISRELKSLIATDNGQSDVNALLAQLVARGEKAQNHFIKVQSEEVFGLMRTHAEINASRKQKFNVLWNAMGHATHDAGGLVAYAPPIDTVRRPYVAYVKTKRVLGLADDVGMVIARTEEELRSLTKDLTDDFDVFTKSDSEAYFKAKGQYEYGLTMNESRVNSELARRGKLGAAQPETRFDNIATDYLQWHARQEESLIRGAVQTGSRKFFAEMDFLSKEYRKVAESQSRGLSAKFRGGVADPFGDYIKTALNISKQSEYPLLDSLNETVDRLGIEIGRAWEKAFGDAKAGVLPWEQADQMLQRYGHGGFYKNAETYATVNEPYAKNAIRGVISRVNTLLAGVTLRLDFANSLVTMISSPLMIGTELASIKRLVAQDSALSGQLNELMSVAVPGSNGTKIMPSTTKLMYKAVNNYFKEGNKDLIARYQSIGAIKDISSKYFEMLDDLAFRPDSKASAWLNRVEAGIDKGAKFTGNNFSEEIARFVAADVMRQVTQPLVDAGKMQLKTQDAYISSFVNRAQGNYVASQRPIIFQGTTGAAIGLFQTYAFNVLQQLHRYMKAGDRKTVATFGALQTFIFGLNGLPFFDAINTTVAGQWVANNPDNKDLYSVLPAFNKEMGDWMLYGSASAFPIFTGAMPALYSRGDMNPRHITIVPTNPLDVPAVAASLKVFDAVAGFGKNIMGGMDLSTALLTGMERQGVSRPLAGLAQTLAGQATNGKGALISAANEVAAGSMLGALSERMIDYGGAGRIMGARPMDEAVALQQMYRMKNYEALDRARVERLGIVVKSKLYNGDVPTDEEYDDFLERYARIGGRVEHFNRAMLRWTRDANVSVVNQMANKAGNQHSQQLFGTMGGEELGDYTNQQ